MTLEVRQAEGQRDLDEARRLFRAFLAWHRSRPGGARDQVDAYFDEPAWEAELAWLPGVYDPPEGALLLAWLDGAAVGCVAMRPLGSGACEMKRMYVEQAGRGRGVGRALADAVVDAAISAGHSEMVLDTSVDQREAIGLYRSLGFTETEPYYDLGPELRRWLLFFRLPL